MKNKITTLALALLLMFSLTACQNKNQNEEISAEITNRMTKKELDSVSVGEAFSHILNGYDYESLSISAFYDGKDFLVTGTDFYLEETLERLKEMVAENGGGEQGIAIDNPNSYIDMQEWVDRWGINDDEIIEIWDSVREISIYDVEMDFTFIIHVTLPPNFDENKTYPMFMMTDGVWSFSGEHYTRWKMMQNGEIEDVILVSIGYSFSVDGTDVQVRGGVFCENNELFLNFITDNLTPYLNELYYIDFSRSGLYGASLGGTFTHYAAFNSDKYENQPFQYYIIASPAFWSPSFLDFAPNAKDFKTEYGYFDRNKTFTKEIFIVGGENEDPENERHYIGESVSTLTGITNFIERMENKGVTTVTSKIYEGGLHGDYLHGMFDDFFLEHYGLKKD
jgi:hypothetical protein